MLPRRKDQSRADQREANRRRVLEVGLLVLLLRRRRAAESSALLLGRDPGTAIIEAVRSSVLTGRTVARDFGRRTIDAQFGMKTAPIEMSLLIDAERAAQLAERHLAWVRREALKSEAATITARWDDALARTEWRVRSLAATESFSAANTERDMAARQVSLETGVDLWKRWNAYADACPVCRAVDGETVRVTESFSAGEPGSVHPSCACWSDIVDERGRIAA